MLRVLVRAVRWERSRMAPLGKMVESGETGAAVVIPGYPDL